MQELNPKQGEEEKIRLAFLQYYFFFLNHVSDTWVQKTKGGRKCFDNFRYEMSIILPCEN